MVLRRARERATEVDENGVENGPEIDPVIGDQSGGGWEVDDERRTIRRTRRTDVVRVRKLSSGPTPCVGITIPAKLLPECGLDIGDRVYVLLEEEGRLIVERVSTKLLARQRDRAQLVPLHPQERKQIREALMELVYTLESESVQMDGIGNRKAARLRVGRAGRLRWLARKIGGQR